MFNITPIHFVLALAYVTIPSYAWSPTSTFCDRSIVVCKRQPRRRQSPAHPSRLSNFYMISEQQLGTFEVIETAKSPSERKVALLDYITETGSSTSPLLIDFETAWAHQRQILEDQMERLKICNTNESDASFLPAIREDDEITTTAHRDTIIMLQHNPVYTLGTGSDEKFVKALNGESDESTDESIPFVPIVRMDRGGEVTYHGPGQITVYPVLDLRSYRQDIHWYMRALEEAIILAISRCSTNTKALRAEREDGVTGVWIDNHKVAAVGIKCRRWVTQHGLAVNVEESSLSNFQGIVPCGLEGRKVGCLNQFLIAQGDEPITVGDFAILMKEALEEIFRIELVNRPLLF